MPLRCDLPLVLALVVLTTTAAWSADPEAQAAPAIPAFEGSITVAEVLEGRAPDRQEQEELERYGALVRERLARIRAELPTAPPVVSQVLHQDEAAATSELDRVVLGGGGSLRLATTTYTISKGRVLVTTGDMHLLVDRLRRTGQALSGGQVQAVDLADPVPDDATGEPAEAIQDHPVRRFNLTVATATYRVDVATDLPNVYALALLKDAPPDALATALARLPGLPMVVEIKDGPITRRQQVETITTGPVDDTVFRPWQ